MQNELTVAAPALSVDLVKISDGLKRLQQVQAEIAELKQEGETITIVDDSDKDGYVKTKAYLSKVRPKRTALENERKETVRPLNEVVAMVNDKYKECGNEYSQMEAPHKGRKEKFEVAEEKRKADEAAAAEKIVTDKIHRLMDAGLEYDPQNGYYRNDVGIAVTRTNIANLSDEDLDGLVAKVSERSQQLKDEQAREFRRISIINDRKATAMNAGMMLNGEHLMVHALDGAVLRIPIEGIENFILIDFSEKVEQAKAVLASNKEIIAKQKKVAETNAKQQQYLQKQREDFEEKQKEFEQKQKDLDAKEVQQKQEEQNRLSTIAMKEALAKSKAERLVKETENKTAAKEELALIYPFITTIEETNAVLTEEDFEHISEYVLKMKTSIDIVLANFRSDTQHFSA